MPELPDVTLYLEALQTRVVGTQLRRVRLFSPFVLRSVDPPISALDDRVVAGVQRLGKRVVLDFEGGLHLVAHLMIAGRLRWKAGKAKPNRKLALAVWEFDAGHVHFTEASSKKRASLHVVTAEGLEAHRRSGLEPLEITAEQFRDQVRRENHTLKRTLTDQRLFSGIGNAYSDEILHKAQLSPVTWSTRLSDDDIERLYQATREVLVDFTDRMREELNGRFPEKVTAFRKDMAVHGKHGEPCPVCGDPVQRIQYADNQTNYCPTCQTGGNLLKDRAMSQLLKKDWPRTLEELETHLAERKQ